MKVLYLLPLFAALLVAGCGEKSPNEEAAAVEPLGDSAIDKALKEAVDFDSLEERESLFYQNNEPFSGWIKGMYDSGQVRTLSHFIDGKLDGPSTAWHENGQKAAEGTYKDGEIVSGKYWNSKGEEVGTRYEAEGKQENSELERLREAIETLEESEK